MVSLHVHRPQRRQHISYDTVSFYGTEFRPWRVHHSFLILLSQSLIFYWRCFVFVMLSVSLLLVYTALVPFCLVVLTMLQTHQQMRSVDLSDLYEWACSRVYFLGYLSDRHHQRHVCRTLDHPNSLPMVFVQKSIQ